MAKQTALLIQATRLAHEDFRTHVDACHACGCDDRLCAQGARLHTAYADLATAPTAIFPQAASPERTPR